jgi:hypothetical protein
MRKHTLKFFTEAVRQLTGGEVRHVRTVQVPASWWQSVRTNSKPDLKLDLSVVHVFEVERSVDEVMKGETAIRWMGRQGFAYVWNYHKNGSSYYMRLFYNPDRGVVDVASAVKYSAQSGRPWN